MLPTSWMQHDEDRGRGRIKEQGLNDSKLWLQKSYLFSVPPSIIANIKSIWSMCLNCSIIPEHSTNQTQESKGKTSGKKKKKKKKKQKHNLNEIQTSLFFSHTTPHLHSKQLEL
jgi:hypothetical protein